MKPRIFVFLQVILFAMASSTTQRVIRPTNESNSDISNSSLQWRHKTVFIAPSDDTTVLGIPQGEALPLGVPFEFETSLFKGRMLIRLRHATSDDLEKHTAYFEGRKRLIQMVVQGQFKKPLSFADVYVGGIFQEPMRLVPPPPMMKIMHSLFSRLAPGLIMDLASSKPKVLSLYASTAQSIRMDAPGDERDITLVDVDENIGDCLGKRFKSIWHRKKHMSIPKKASQYQFDTEHVYTFHNYDDTVDYGRYTIKLPLYGDFNLVDAIGIQPMSLAAVTSTGETIFNFLVWHESVSGAFDHRQKPAFCAAPHSLSEAYSATPSSTLYIKS